MQALAPEAIDPKALRAQRDEPIVIGESTSRIPPGLRDNAFFVLEETTNALREEVQNRLEKSLSIVPRHLAILSVLHKQGSMSQIELGNIVGVNRNVMVQVVDQLEQLGLAERQKNKANRREYQIQLTRKGRETIDEGRRIVRDAVNQCLHSLTEGERKQFVALLLKLACS